MQMELTQPASASVPAHFHSNGNDKNHQEVHPPMDAFPSLITATTNGNRNKRGSGYVRPPGNPYGGGGGASYSTAPKQPQCSGFY